MEYCLFVLLGQGVLADDTVGRSDHLQKKSNDERNPEKHPNI